MPPGLLDRIERTLSRNSREIHPNVLAAQAKARELRHLVADFRERSDRIVARRPSPTGMVIPEVDVMGRLRNLYLAPGVCARFGNEDLVLEIMVAVRESTLDARQQYRNVMNTPDHPPQPSREWQSRPGRAEQIPNSGSRVE